MLGVYKNFPKDVQWRGTFSFSISAKRLQQILFDFFENLNDETLSLDEVADPSVPGCEVNFEVGIADGGDFCFFGDEVRFKLLATLDKQSIDRLDFMFVMRYRKMLGQTRVRMRFDYYVLRLMFGENAVLFEVAHEKGVRRISPDDLVSLLVDRINEMYPRKILKAVEDDD